RKDREESEASPVRQGAEDAEPGQADEQADRDEKREDEGPEPFNQHRKPHGKARARKPARKRVTAMVGSPFGHSLPSGRAIAPSRLREYQQTRRRRGRRENVIAGWNQSQSGIESRPMRSS